MPPLSRDDVHYQAISAFYGDKRAKRSNVPLIQHIDEGLYILNKIGADTLAQAAYCLHPLFQGDDELAAVRPLIAQFDPWALVLVMEYRNIANAYLSRRTIASIAEIQLSPLTEVNQMLLADKIQNRKDFERYHKGIHPRSTELDQYFKNWLTRLGVSREFYEETVAELDALSR